MNVISVDPGVTCTGIYVFKNGKGRSGCISRGGIECAVRRPVKNRYEYLAYLWECICDQARGLDLALVEDYAYSRSSGGGVSSIEAGSIVRSALANDEVPIVLVNPSIWKSLTIGRRKKNTVREKREYCRLAEKLAGRTFRKADEVDAYLIYSAALRIWKSGGRTDAEKKIFLEISTVKGELNERAP